MTAARILSNRSQCGSVCSLPNYQRIYVCNIGICRRRKSSRASSRTSETPWRYAGSYCVHLMRAHGTTTICISFISGTSPKRSILHLLNTNKFDSVSPTAACQHVVNQYHRERLEKIELKNLRSQKKKSQKKKSRTYPRCEITSMSC